MRRNDAPPPRPRQGPESSSGGNSSGSCRGRPEATRTRARMDDPATRPKGRQPRLGNGPGVSRPGPATTRTRGRARRKLARQSRCAARASSSPVVPKRQQQRRDEVGEIVRSPRSRSPATAGRDRRVDATAGQPSAAAIIARRRKVQRARERQRILTGGPRRRTVQGERNVPRVASVDGRRDGGGGSGTSRITMVVNII